ncbi:hypothetical protein GF357_03685 [Candidatus Dojkabacteria bacterium]|nr:hypothetical protein [Candidatus Dojkabacteria bacterium]
MRNKAKNRIYKKIRRRKRVELRDSAYFLGKSKQRIEKERGKKLNYRFIGRKIVRAVLGMWIVIAVSRGLVGADDFYPEADGWDCEFGYAESVSMHSLPSNQNLPGRVTYNSDLIVGEGANFPQNHEMDDVVEFNYPYSRRMLGVADRVNVPPDARVDVGYFVRNYSGHRINTNGGWLFLSKTGGGGDWTRLGAHGWQNRQVTLNLDGHRIVKSGKAVWIGNLGSWPDHDLSDLPKGWTIYTFEISQPIVVQNQVVNYHFDANKNLIVDMSVILRNNSVYQLNNVRYRHGGFSVAMNFQPGQSRTINYSRNMGRNYDKDLNLGFGQVSDPNSQRECIVIGTDWGDDDDENNSNRWMLYSYRDDSDSSDGWWGIQAEYPFRPKGNTMCVTRIPYNVNTQNFRLELEAELSLNSLISDSDEFGLKEVNSIINEPIEIAVEVANSGARADNVCTSLEYDSSKLEITDACGGVVGENIVRWSPGSLHYQDSWDCTVKARVRDLTEPFDGVLINKAEAGDEGICRLEAETRINLNSSIEIEVEKNASAEIIKFGDEVEFVIHVRNLGNGIAEAAVLSDDCTGCEGLEFLGFGRQDILFDEEVNIGKGDYLVTQRFHVIDEFVDSAENCVVLSVEDSKYTDCVQLYLDESHIGSGYNPIISPPIRPIGALDDLIVGFSPKNIVSQLFPKSGVNSFIAEEWERELVKTGGLRGNALIFSVLGLIINAGFDSICIWRIKMLK